MVVKWEMDLHRLSVMSVLLLFLVDDICNDKNHFHQHRSSGLVNKITAVISINFVNRPYFHIEPKRFFETLMSCFWS